MATPLIVSILGSVLLPHGQANVGGTLLTLLDIVYDLCFILNCTRMNTHAETYEGLDRLFRKTLLNITLTQLNFHTIPSLLSSLRLDATLLTAQLSVMKMILKPAVVTKAAFHSSLNLNPTHANTLECPVDSCC